MRFPLRDDGDLNCTTVPQRFIYDNNIRELAAGALAGLGSLLEL